MWRSRRAFIYIFSDILPSFILGVLVFISILLMFQALRLTEFILLHGIKFQFVLDLMTYMSISFLPMIMPMSLLFAVLLTYNRLSHDSEFIALKGIGHTPSSLITPAISMGLIAALFSMQIAFYLAPWGNRQFELLISYLGNTKAAASIKEGTFSEGFFDLVIYANKVNSDQGLLQNLFIYDDKNPKSPLTAIAPEGQIIPDENSPGHSVKLRLFNGQIYRSGMNNTVVNFDSYDITLNDPIRFEERKKSSPSLNYQELSERLTNPEYTSAEQFQYLIEFHKRFALAGACLVFSIIGSAFGIQNNRRSGKSNGFVTSVGFIVLYWILYILFEGMARNQVLTPIVGTWLANFVLTLWGLIVLRKKLN